MTIQRAGGNVRLCAACACIFFGSPSLSRQLHWIYHHYVALQPPHAASGMGAGRTGTALAAGSADDHSVGSHASGVAGRHAQLAVETLFSSLFAAHGAVTSVCLSRGSGARSLRASRTAISLSLSLSLSLSRSYTVSWVRRPVLTRASATLCHLALSLGRDVLPLRERRVALLGARVRRPRLGTRVRRLLALGIKALDPYAPHGHLYIRRYDDLDWVLYARCGVTPGGDLTMEQFLRANDACVTANRLASLFSANGVAILRSGVGIVHHVQGAGGALDLAKVGRRDDATWHPGGGVGHIQRLSRLPQPSQRSSQRSGSRRFTTRWYQ